MEPVTSGYSQRRQTPGLIAVAAVLLGCYCALTAAEVSEYQVKAVFLLNFTKFIEWPKSAFAAPDSPINICVMGDDPFGKMLGQVLTGEVVSGRRVEAERVKAVPAPKTCQVLFVSGQEKEAMKSLAQMGPGVLTVGEGQTFLSDGGMIAFVIENRRVRFGINETAAANAGLIVSSKLLKIAKPVEKE
jgi:hypothetical protein